jgi:catechol 2,3-dioxygenase-like lactoylglutathione lyase family enzyme
MSTTEVTSEAGATAGLARVDMKLEVVVLPVADFDRALEFYGGALGWRSDGVFTADDGSRATQFTPPGSGCSIQFGEGVTTAPPGTAQALHLVVTDIDAARAELIAHGVPASEVYHCDSGYACRYPGRDGRVPGRHPEDGTYASFVSFEDPDGNGWVLQEVTTRFPGRVEGETAYASPGDLAQALRRAAAAHAQHEARTGEADEDWPTWYADFMVRELAGRDLAV